MYTLRRVNVVSFLLAALCEIFFFDGVCIDYYVIRRCNYGMCNCNILLISGLMMRLVYLREFISSQEAFWLNTDYFHL